MSSVFEVDGPGSRLISGHGRGLGPFPSVFTFSIRQVMKHMAEHCTGVSLHIETVSGGVTEIPYLASVEVMRDRYGAGLR